MSILIGLFSFALVVTSILIILLVLVQLPKKEAGGGLAFGGGASQAVLGAGAGNALTRLTRNLAIVFLSIAFLTSVLVSQRHGAGEDVIDAGLGEEEVLPEGSLDIDALLGGADADPEAAGGSEAPVDGDGAEAPSTPPLLELTSPSEDQEGAAPETPDASEEPEAGVDASEDTEAESPVDGEGAPVEPEAESTPENP